MTADNEPDTFSARLLRRDAQRRAALELSTANPVGLENAMARLSAEMTEEAEARRAANASPAPRPSTP
jgi:hypothetical protein